MRTQDAKKIRLEDLLATLGYLPARAAKGGSQLWYHSPIRNADGTDKDPSFKVNTKKNTWYDFGSGKGGNILNFVADHENLDLKTNLPAVLAFLDKQTINEYTNTQVARIFGGEVKIRKVNEVKHKGLIAYLKERKIDLDIAKKYLKEVHYNANRKPYFALTMQNDSQGFEVRNKYFKGGLRNKDITTVKRENGDNNVSVFEGFMDFLSILTEQGITEFKGDVIILNSTSLIDEGIEAIKGKKYGKVFAFLDNDNAGKEALEKLKASHPSVKDLSHLYQGYNDPNAKLTGRTF